jgi:glyoxylase-like metal-dependent hydrolase (beta-lactamase superfamily II)
MEHLASGISFLDLRFLGHRRIIACGVLHGFGGVALIDPGPSTTLPVLRHELESAGLSTADVDTILLTHIHLDHAGATGTLVLENPRVRVYVHANGAQHLAAPEKLIASATRLYGDQMDRLWGEIRPVPQTAIVALNGGEIITVGGRSLRVAYTPGHASHHVSYFSEDAGIAFVGDTAGIRLTPSGYIVPPTPPPDIDLDSWRESLARIESWNSQTLFVTHFGPHAPPRPHLSELADRLTLFAQLAKKSLERGENDEEREAWFSDQIRAELRRRVGDQELVAYEMAGRLDLNWRGLVRYWRKQAARSPVW